MVQCVSGGNCADQDEHDESHALLTVVRSVEEADARAGEKHERADGPRRRLVVFRRFVEGGGFDEPFGDQDKEGGSAKAQYRRDEQNLKNLDGLLPIHSGGDDVGVEQLVGQADKEWQQ